MVACRTGPAAASRLEGARVTACQQGGEDGRPELVQVAGGAGVLEGLRDRGDPLVGGDDLGGGQFAAGQGGVPRAFVPGFDPGLGAAFVRAAARRLRVERQHHPAQSRPQLPCGHPLGQSDQRGGDGRGPGQVEHGEFLGEHRRAGPVDPPGEQRRQHHRQPAQVTGQGEQRIGGPAGERQRGGELLADVLSRAGRTRTSGLRPSAGGELGDRGELHRGLPRRQPPGRRQQADQLVIGQRAQPGQAGVLREPREHRIGRQPVERAARGEPSGRLAGPAGWSAAQRAARSSSSGSLRSASHASSPSGGPAYGSGHRPSNSASVGSHGSGPSHPGAPAASAGALGSGPSHPGAPAASGGTARAKGNPGLGGGSPIGSVMGCSAKGAGQLTVIANDIEGV